MKTVVEKCKDGQSVRELCELADAMIISETSQIFKKEKELKKGLPFVNSFDIAEKIHFLFLVSL